MKNRVALVVVLLTLAALPLAAQEAQPAPTPMPAAAVAAAPPPVAAASTLPRAYMDEVTVVVNGKAKTNGLLQLEFLPVGGEPRAISVNVLAKTRDNDIARDIHKELTLVAGGAYKLKLSGGDVRITKKSKSAANVSVVVTGLALPGVSVHIE